MNLTGVDFLLTFNCPARCMHCAYKAGPEQKGIMNLEDIELWLYDLRDQPLQSILFHGGEPLVFYDLLLSAIKITKLYQISEIWIITNSFWAKDKKKAIKILKELKQAGLSHITFSLDAFHQEFIPLKYVQNAITAALEVEFQKIFIDSYFLPELASDSNYNIKTRELILKMTDFPRILHSKRTLQLWGRASEFLKVNKPLQIPKGKCKIPFWLGDDIKDPKTIEIDFKGNITLCTGISIGNAKKSPLSEVLKNFDWTKHPILRPIIENGPIGLYEIAREKGYMVEPFFINECHMCYEVRKYLRLFFPEYLVPSRCY